MRMAAGLKTSFFPKIPRSPGARAASTYFRSPILRPATTLSMPCRVGPASKWPNSIRPHCAADQYRHPLPEWQPVGHVGPAGDGIGVFGNSFGPMPMSPGRAPMYLRTARSARCARSSALSIPASTRFIPTSISTSGSTRTKFLPGSPRIRMATGSSPSAIST